MMAKLTDELTEWKNRSYDVKWEGYRALLLKDHDKIQLRSRNDRDLAVVQ